MRNVFLSIIVISSVLGCSNNYKYTCIDDEIGASYEKVYGFKISYLRVLNLIEDKLKNDSYLEPSQLGYMRLINDFDKMNDSDKLEFLNTIDLYSDSFANLKSESLPLVVLTSCCYCVVGADDERVVLYDEIIRTGGIPSIYQLELLSELTDFNVNEERLIFLNFVYFRFQGIVYPSMN